MSKCWSAVLLSSLLCGCAGVNTSNAPANLAAAEEMSAGQKLVHWPVNLVLDFYDVFDLNFGTGKNDYDFGAHAQLTKLVRLGVFDYADLEILGANNALHNGPDFWTFDQAKGDFKVGLKIGMGAGAAGSMDLWEIWDWAAGVVSFNQYNPSGDHTHM